MRYAQAEIDATIVLQAGARLAVGVSFQFAGRCVVIAEVRNWSVVVQSAESLCVLEFRSSECGYDGPLDGGCAKTWVDCCRRFDNGKRYAGSPGVLP